MPSQASQPTTAADQGQFQALCAELDEYEHLPELTPGAVHPQRLITGEDHEETLDASILAGLTLP